MSNRQNRDDFNRDRLFLHIEKKWTLKINEIKTIKPNVYLLYTNGGKRIIKGYKNPERLNLQIKFSQSLHQNGFQFTSFYENHRNLKPIVFNDERYWGIMPYIENSFRFTFSSLEDRLEASRLINTFHTYSKSILQQFSPFIPTFNLYAKWIFRLKMFYSRRSSIEFYIGKEKFKVIESWSNWSLHFLYSELQNAYEESLTIVHGDVAHHNFVRDINKTLYLIDFDLISIAPPSFDYVQFANRISAYANWSFQELRSYPELEKYLQKRWFLCALLFPTDILREWNRYFRLSPLQQINELELIKTATEKQVEGRKEFVGILFNMVR